MIGYLFLFTVLAALSRQQEMKGSARQLLVTHNGWAVDMVHLFRIDLVRAMRQQAHPRHVPHEDTQYMTLAEVDALRLFLGPQCQRQFHDIDYDEENQVMNIWVPTPLSPAYRPNLRYWKTLWEKWDKLVTPEAQALFPNGEANPPPGQRKLPTYNKEPKSYIVSKGFGQIGKPFRTPAEAMEALRDAPASTREGVLGVIEIDDLGAHWRGTID